MTITEILWVILIIACLIFFFCMWKIRPLSSKLFKETVRYESELLNNNHPGEHGAKAMKHYNLDKPFGKMMFWLIAGLAAGAVATLAAEALFR